MSVQLAAQAPELTLAEQARLVAALREPACYPHPANEVQGLETHISHVLLAGDYAYKIKKPLDLGFLDFATLDKRRYLLRRGAAPQPAAGAGPLSRCGAHRRQRGCAAHGG